MKKIALLFLGAALATTGISTMAQSTGSVRQSLQASDFNEVRVLNKSSVTWVHDSETFLQVSWLTTEQPSSSYFITVRDKKLEFCDSLGRYQYELHLDSNAKIGVVVDDNGNFIYPNGKRIKSTTTSSSSLREIANDLKGLIDEMVDTYDSVSAAKGGSAEYYYSNKGCKRQYSLSDRTDFKFHWAFNNWGDKWYNGLMKLDGAYNLRTSFSSYQLSENYAVVMTPHIKLSVGIGYESDVYKFSENYVTMDMTDGSFNILSQNGLDGASGTTFTDLDDWSTRLVTRYVTMPIEFEYRDKTSLGSFRISLGLIPGLSFNSKHTGLKHELEERGRNTQKVDDVSKFINPYKLDLRLTFKRKFVGVFVQVPTLPLFIDTDTKVYPIKIGFVF